MSENLITVGQAASEIRRERGGRVTPRILTDLLYRRILSEDRCPLVGARRMIPRDYIAEVTAVLEARGYIPSAEVARG
jgi:hypothetical protein